MNILSGIGLLSDLNESELDNFALFCQEKQVKAGNLIFNEDDNANAMYILKEGNVEITRTVEGGKIVLGEVHAEEILGEMALFGDRSKRMATAMAITDCILITILSFSINDLTNKHPELLEKIKLIIKDRIISNKEKLN